VAALVFGIALATLWTLHPEERDPRFYKSGGEVRVVTLDGGDREMARRIAARWRPGDVVLTTSLTRASLEYYLAREARDPVFVSFPRETAGHLGSQNDARWLADRAALLREAEAAVGAARARLGPGGRVFLVRARSEVNTPLKPGPLARRFGLPRVEHLGHFGQAGTGTLVELSLHAPAADGASRGDGG